MYSDLTDFIARHGHIFALTGAGLSTASGIPDYRDEQGNWKARKPMDYREFSARHEARQRYWARSCVGWPRFRRALPNRAHLGLAELEMRGLVTATVTQNVDGLQQRAGSERVIELHGSLDQVECLGCGAAIARETLQHRLLAANPELARLSARMAPDGDAELDGFDTRDLRVPACLDCGGILKPGVVFFGEAVPARRVEAGFATLAEARAVLVLGSSLMVYSGFRFVREAVRRGLPVAAVNRGATRADDMLELKLEADCGSALAAVLEDLGPRDAEIA
jgi:NAD-dependent SIR2 family protein deacetylase